MNPAVNYEVINQVASQPRSAMSTAEVLVLVVAMGITIMLARVMR